MDVKKRGQATLFIIIAMVIVIILSVTIYVVTRTSTSLGSLEKDRSFVEGQIGAVQAHISRCIESETETAVSALLKNGGKTQIEPHALSYFGTPVNYLLYSGANTMNLRVEIERSLSQKILSRLDKECSLDAFKDMNPRPEKRKITVQTTLLDTAVKVDVTYPITFRKGKYQTTLTEFKTFVGSDFGRLYRTADTIVNQEAGGGEFDATPYQLSFPGIHIKKDSQNANEKVYTLTTDEEKEFLLFATQQ